MEIYNILITNQETGEILAREEIEDEFFEKFLLSVIENFKKERK